MNALESLYLVAVPLVVVMATVALVARLILGGRGAPKRVVPGSPCSHESDAAGAPQRVAR